MSFQPRFATPESSPAKKFADNGMRTKAASPSKTGTSPKRKSPSKMIPVVPLKRIKPGSSKKIGLPQPEKKTELVPPGMKKAKVVLKRRSDVKKLPKLSKVSSRKSVKSKVQTAASSKVKRALKIGRAQPVMRATRAATAALELAKLQEEQMKSLEVESDLRSPKKAKHEKTSKGEVASPSNTASPKKQKSKFDSPVKHKDKPPKDSDSSIPGKGKPERDFLRGRSPRLESPSRKQTPSPQKSSPRAPEDTMKTRSTSKLDHTPKSEKKNGKSKKRHSEGSLAASSSPVKVLRDRSPEKATSPETRSQRSRALSMSESVIDVSPVKSEPHGSQDNDQEKSPKKEGSHRTKLKKKKRDKDKKKKKADKLKRKEKKIKDKAMKDSLKEGKDKMSKKEHRRLKKKHKLKMKLKREAELRESLNEEKLISPVSSPKKSKSSMKPAGKNAFCCYL